MATDWARASQDLDYLQDQLTKTGRPNEANLRFFLTGQPECLWTLLKQWPDRTGLALALVAIDADTTNANFGVLISRADGVESEALLLILQCLIMREFYALVGMFLARFPAYGTQIWGNERRPWLLSFAIDVGVGPRAVPYLLQEGLVGGVTAAMRSMYADAYAAATEVEDWYSYAYLLRHSGITATVTVQTVDQIRRAGEPVWWLLLGLHVDRRTKIIRRERRELPPSRVRSRMMIAVKEVAEQPLWLLPTHSGPLAALRSAVGRDLSTYLLQAI